MQFFSKDSIAANYILTAYVYYCFIKKMRIDGELRMKNGE